jgi:hypothetical protein
MGEDGWGRYSQREEYILDGHAVKREEESQGGTCLRRLKKVFEASLDYKVRPCLKKAK